MEGPKSTLFLLPREPQPPAGSDYRGGLVVRVKVRFLTGYRGFQTASATPIVVITITPSTTQSPQCLTLLTATQAARPNAPNPMTNWTRVRTTPMIGAGR